MKDFDELQKINRGEIALQTMLLTFILIFINGFFISISGYNIWGDSGIEALFLVYIPVMYFSTMAILKDAYTYENSKKVKTIIIMFVILSVLNLSVILQGIYRGVFKVIEHNRLSYGSTNVLVAVFFGYIAILLFIKQKINKKKS